MFPDICFPLNVELIEKWDVFDWFLFLYLVEFSSWKGQQKARAVYLDEVPSEGSSL